MRYALNQCSKKINPNGTITFTGVCVKTGKPYSVTVLQSQLKEYLDGKSIQKAFPNTSADDREFMISGYSPEGWNQLFPPEED